MIGVWGGADKIKAAVKFFVYTMAGSVLMLGRDHLYLVVGQPEAHRPLLVRLPRALARGAPARARCRWLCFWGLRSIAFFIKVPMWPVHTWLPDAHVQAPTGGSVILAAVHAEARHVRVHALLDGPVPRAPRPAAAAQPRGRGHPRRRPVRRARRVEAATT